MAAGSRFPPNPRRPGESSQGIRRGCRPLSAASFRRAVLCSPCLSPPLQDPRPLADIEGAISFFPFSFLFHSYSLHPRLARPSLSSESSCGVCGVTDRSGPEYLPIFPLKQTASSRESVCSKSSSPLLYLEIKPLLHKCRTGLVVHTCLPRPGRQRQEDQESEVSLSHIASLRPAQAM